MSSTTTITGPSAASSSSSRRTAQNDSSVVRGSPWPRNDASTGPEPGRLGMTADQPIDVLDRARPGHLAEQVGDRRERRRAPALEPQVERSRLAARAQLVGETGLAHARVADHGREPSRRVGRPRRRTRP